MPEKYRQLQQGDILLQEAASIPEGAMQTSDRGRIILASGERTGHSHIVNSDKAKLWELTRNGVSETYLEVQASVNTVHDEHKSLPIPPGIYLIGRVKEYDYTSQMERQLED